MGLGSVGEDVADGVEVAEAVLPMQLDVGTFAPFVPSFDQDNASTAGFLPGALQDQLRIKEMSFEEFRRAAEAHQVVVPVPGPAVPTAANGQRREWNGALFYNVFPLTPVSGDERFKRGVVAFAGHAQAGPVVGGHGVIAFQRRAPRTPPRPRRKRRDAGP